MALPNDIIVKLRSDIIRKIFQFEGNLNTNDEWLFFHLAWAHSKTGTVQFEDKYEIMKRWDEFKD